MGRIDQESIKKELIELFCLFLDEPGNDSAH
ncbi:MAG: hypothetical protein PWR30_523, partial [Candidatus Woesearchaeota archaeon]|nr:hypothetical protein [Candidatus Woesearchaeota archaeon]